MSVETNSLDGQPGAGDQAHGCAVAGCQRPVEPFAAPGLPDFCAAHRAAVSAGALARCASAERRLAVLRAFWDDECRFEAVIASGRYLKLANASVWAEEILEAARNRALFEATAAEGRRVLAAESDSGERRTA